MSASEASASGKFIGTLLGKGMIPQPEAVFMVRAGFRLYRADVERTTFIRGFFRGMTTAGLPAENAEAIINQAKGESAA